MAQSASARDAMFMSRRSDLRCKSECLILDLEPHRFDRSRLIRGTAKTKHCGSLIVMLYCCCLTLTF
jgi:hypothetical protein